MVIDTFILALVFSFISSFLISYYIIPKVMKKMLLANHYGIDVNKFNKPKIPEMGGIGGVIGFSLGTTFVLGIIKYFSEIDSIPVLVSVSVIGLASLIGLMDDVSLLGRKEKAWFIAFASLPLIISQIGVLEIDMLLFDINFNTPKLRLLFWLIIVPFGITSCSNALNMSAGYNGLESGHILIISISLLIISLIEGTELKYVIIYSGLVGSTGALFLFNKYPSKTFVGDIGTLGFGSLIATSVIMSGHIIFGMICIAPTYYELYATIKYKIKGIERRDLCMNPILKTNGNIGVPEGAEDYTLAYFLLSKKGMTEQSLVNILLGFYLVSGFIAIFLSFIFR